MLLTVCLWGTGGVCSSLSVRGVQVVCAPHCLSVLPAEDDLIYLDPHHPQAAVRRLDNGTEFDVQVGWEVVWWWDERWCVSGTVC